MKAIVTKYVGPGNVKGSRIIASDTDGNRVIVHYESRFNSDDNHINGARSLCKKMDWHGELIGGHIKGGMVFVWNSGSPHFTV